MKVFDFKDFVNLAESSIMKYSLRFNFDHLEKLAHREALSNTVSAFFTNIIIFLFEKLISPLFILLMNTVIMYQPMYLP